MVDDDDTDILIATRCHARSGIPYPLRALHSGEELLAHLDAVSAGTEPMPRTVLLDISMPGLDGFTTLGKVRARAEFAAIPVIMMLTNSDHPKDQERALALGANGFQTKPNSVSAYVAFFASLAE